MVNNADIQEFINCSLYKKALDVLEERYDVFINKEEFPSILLDHDVKKMVFSGASISDLKNILSDDLDSFLKYIAIKLNIILSESDQQEGNDDEDVIIRRLAPYKNFLIVHLLEYYLIVHHVDKLNDYLKKIRIPNSSKYSVQIQKIYSSM